MVASEQMNEQDDTFNLSIDAPQKDIHGMFARSFFHVIMSIANVNVQMTDEKKEATQQLPNLVRLAISHVTEASAQERLRKEFEEAIEAEIQGWKKEHDGRAPNQTELARLRNKVSNDFIGRVLTESDEWIGISTPLSVSLGKRRD